MAEKTDLFKYQGKPVFYIGQNIPKGVVAQKFTDKYFRVYEQDSLYYIKGDYGYYNSWESDNVVDTDYSFTTDETPISYINYTGSRPKVKNYEKLFECEGRTWIAEDEWVHMIDNTLYARIYITLATTINNNKKCIKITCNKYASISVDDRANNYPWSPDYEPVITDEWKYINKGDYDDVMFSYETSTEYWYESDFAGNFIPTHLAIVSQAGGGGGGQGGTWTGDLDGTGGGGGACALDIIKLNNIFTHDNKDYQIIITAGSARQGAYNYSGANGGTIIIKRWNGTAYKTVETIYGGSQGTMAKSTSNKVPKGGNVEVKDTSFYVLHREQSGMDGKKSYDGSAPTTINVNWTVSDTIVDTSLIANFFKLTTSKTTSGVNGGSGAGKNASGGGGCSVFGNGGDGGADTKPGEAATGYGAGGGGGRWTALPMGGQKGGKGTPAKIWIYY